MSHRLFEESATSNGVGNDFPFSIQKPILSALNVKIHIKTLFSRMGSTKPRQNSFLNWKFLDRKIASPVQEAMYETTPLTQKFRLYLYCSLVKVRLVWSSNRFVNWIVSRKSRAADLRKALLMANLQEQHYPILKRVIGAVSEELRFRTYLTAFTNKGTDLPGNASQ